VVATEEHSSTQIFSLVIELFRQYLQAILGYGKVL